MSDIPEWARYRAKDGDGTRWYYEDEPKKGYNGWYIITGQCSEVDEFENWEDSLEEIK